MKSPGLHLVRQLQGNCRSAAAASVVATAGIFVWQNSSLPQPAVADSFTSKQAGCRSLAKRWLSCFEIDIPKQDSAVSYVKLPTACLAATLFIIVNTASIIGTT